ANICQEYATKRYRSNVINWGMLPLQMKEAPDFEVGDFIYIPAIKSALKGELSDITAFVVSDHRPVQQITLYMEKLTSSEQDIIKA
ncbi:hydratase, partial [Staphylococcus warneri]